MPEWLRDAGWQGVGAFLALVGMAVTSVIVLAQRRTKLLVCSVVADTLLVGVGQDLQGKVEVPYQGQPVQDVSLIALHIVKRENTPITSGDYERPLSLAFGEHATILSAEVTSTLLASLRASLTTGAGAITLQPVPMSSEDSIL